MSLNRFLMFVAASCWLNAAAASDIRCPGFLKTHGRAQPLHDASVFSGPPEELAELIPDVEKSEWDIELDQMTAKARSQSMYLVCHYAHTSGTIKLQIPHDAKLCKVEGTANGGTVAWCSATLRRSDKSNRKVTNGHQS